MGDHREDYEFVGLYDDCSCGLLARAATGLPLFGSVVGADCSDKVAAVRVLATAWFDAGWSHFQSHRSR